jgi:hypothetical protein
MKQQSKVAEVIEQFGEVGGRDSLLDSLLPPLLYLLANALLGLGWAVGVALTVGVILTVRRVVRGEPVGYALAGLAGVALAAGTAWLSGEAAGFFLPDLISGGVLILATGISALIGRPLVALTSHVARGWPLDWYWHPKVRPAYTEVTLAWTVFFVLRLALQYAAYTSGRNAWATVVGLISGWPATVLLLVASYLYGTWRLGELGGPSVEEFEQDEPPPWEGQQRGF